MSGFQWKDYLNFKKSIKAQMLLVAALPIVASVFIFGGIMLWSAEQGEQKIKVYEAELMSQKKTELRNYVDIAIKAI